MSRLFKHTVAALAAFAVSAAVTFAAFMVTGCSTAPHRARPVVVQSFADESCEATIVRGVHIGVSVDFGNTRCAGADMDARKAQAWLAGRSTTLLLDGAATLANVQEALLVSARGLRPTDWLIVTLAAHGLQRPDLSGDEEDWKDEGIKLYDVVWWDDDIARFVIENLPPCRILFIADTCHSEGNWRSFARRVTGGLYDGREQVQLELDLGMFQRSVAAWPGELAQIAGCRENASSYGDRGGGTLHLALDRELRGAGSITEWFDSAYKIVVADRLQEPVLTTYNASDDFLNGGLPL